jgi:large conductance mechanosensitive channel
MLRGFGQFIMRGNVGAIVTAFVKDLITPLIAATFGKPEFSAIAFEVNSSKFLVGDFINAIVAFLLVAAAIYFFVIVPMDRLFPKKAEAVPAMKECPMCLSDVPAGASRCKFCTGQLT